MNRLIPYIGITLVLAVVFLTAIPAVTYTYVVKELAQTFSAVQTFTAGIVSNNVTTSALTVGSVQVLATDLLSVDEETNLVYPNETATISKVVGINRSALKSVEVRSGCPSYDFTLNNSATFASGTESLIYIGQTYMLYDGNPPTFVDIDGTKTVRAKFWNRGSMACTFELVIKGAAL